MVSQARVVRVIAGLLCIVIISDVIGQASDRIIFESPAPGAQLRGRQLTELVFRAEQDGAPVHNAPVEVLLLAGGGGSLQTAAGDQVVTTTTDNDGRVRIAGLIPIGRGNVQVRVTVRPPGKPPIIGTIQYAVVPAGFWTAGKVNAALAAGAAIAGTVGVYFAARDDPRPTTISAGGSTVGPRR